MKNVLLSWSSGKDSAWALHLLLQQKDIRVAGLLTTFNRSANRVAMHAVRRSLVELQAERTGLPLWPVELPWPCSNADYEELMSAVVRRAIAEKIDAVAFGDLFLEDIRAYRERQLEGTGLTPLFPLWKVPTKELAWEMIEGGLRAKITCIDPSKLDKSYAGCNFDLQFIHAIPQHIDPCGENGEFHSFVYDAPVFSSPILIDVGEVVERDGFVFADVVDRECADATSRRRSG